LREAVREAKKYESELRTLRSLSKGDNFVEGKVKILEKTAKDGTLPLQVLNSEFVFASEKILRKYREEKPNKSLLDKTALNFAKVVHIRKVSADDRSDRTEDILARSSKYIESGNIELALKEIENLSSSEKELLSSWTPKAEDFVSSHIASEDIFQYY
jgi:hypothetical protein